MADAATEISPELDLARYQITALRAYAVAALAILLWDYATTVHLEYRRIWKAPWSIVKVLFFITRYSAIACVTIIVFGFHYQYLSETQCVTYAKMEPVLCVITVASTEAILLIRVWALWGKKIYVLIPLLFCLIVEAAIMFAAAALYVPVEFPPGLAYWIVPLIFDAIVVVMTVTKLAMNRNGSRSKIAKVFLRDGLIYLVTPENFKAANSTLAIALTAIMGCRLVLSLRALDDTSGGSSTSRDRSNSRGPGPVVTIGGTNRRGNVSQPQTTTFGSYKMNEFSTDFVGTLADVNEEQLNHHGQGSYNTEDKDDESLYRSEQPRNAFNPFDPVKIQVQHQTRALSSALSYYKDINPATLTGAIDVIVVQRPNCEEADGYELACTPFHVRFGKLSVLRAAEKKVTLHLNGSETPLDYSMKVGEAGEAFFVFETDIDVPEDLQTSPIISPVDQSDSSVPVSPLPEPADKAHVQGLNLDLSQEPEPLLLNPDHNQSTDDNNEGSNQTTQTIHNAASAVSKVGTALVGGAANVSNLRGDKIKRSRPSKLDINTFERDEEPSDKYLPSYEAKAPSVVYADDVVLDLEGYKQVNDDAVDEVEPSKSDLQHETHAVSEALHHDVQDEQTSHTTEDLTLATFGYDLLTSAHGRKFSLSNSNNQRRDIDDIDGVDENDVLKTDDANNDNNDENEFDVEELKSSLEGLSLSKASSKEPDNEYTWEWGGFPTRSTQATPRIEKNTLGFSQLPTAVKDSASNDSKPTLHCGCNEYEFILEMENAKHVFELAIFGYKEDHIDAVEFEKNKITFDTFIQDVNIVDNKGLVCRYNDSYLDWYSSAPVIASLAIYRRSLNEPIMVSHKDDTDVDTTKKQTHKPQTSESGWSRWWSKSKSDPDLAATAASQAKTEQPPAPPVTPPKQEKQDKKHYAKTLRLTSDQLKSLNLKKGVNNITFSVNSSYSGVAVATARIFYWGSTDQVVISDIDGTITKSDALGHVFTMIGRDWTHIGVAKLYTDITQNGYQILYLTSRAIGQADTTRDYLRNIRQNHYQLPDGPVIMSPDRLMASLHRATSPVSDFVLSEEEEEDEDDDDYEENEDSFDEEDSDGCDIHDVDDLTFENSDIANRTNSTGERSMNTIGDDIEDDFDEDILATREMNQVPFL
ncbi:LNS2-domain-containing protein [Wallemia mellicola]|nr:LNS2-domain-containing protein [Wallemia mellicola]TIC43402.1 LNS2-domain-containing protein [Wallemia mellicola]TIC52406.1 LNS2-domain-containing protein [Wallemia mellicola]